MIQQHKLYALLGVTAFGLSVVAPVQAFDMSGNLAATSTYMWRGVPQTVGSAIQGGANLNLPIGANTLHFGAWTSNVSSSNTINTVVGANNITTTFTVGGTEIDLIAGFSGNFSGLEYDAGLIIYRYPQAASSESFEELYAGISQGSLSAKFSTSSDKGQYIEVAASFPITTWKMTAHFGHYSRDGSPDYADYSVNFSRPMIQGYNLGVMLSDTELSGDDYRTTITLSSAFQI